MAIFCEIKNNVVSHCIVVSEEDCGNKTFPESESIGQAFIASLGFEGLWLQTDENGAYRGERANQDWIYNPEMDIFVAPQRSTIED
jgi:hypothetical protein